MPRQLQPRAATTATATVKTTTSPSRHRRTAAALVVSRAQLLRILKSVVGAEARAAKHTLAVLESLLQDVNERLMHEAVALGRANGRRTLTAHALQAAVKLVLGSDTMLARHALAEAARAVSKAAVGSAPTH